jgi:small subunit ribosomal protein S17
MVETMKEKSVKKRTITMNGAVVSVKADKTVTVSVERIFKHRVYKKIVRRKKKYLAHDEKNKCKVGDQVKLKLVRPISKRKRWLVVDIVSVAPQKEMLSELNEVAK